MSVLQRKAFYFDLDNTLFDYEASFKQASLFAFKAVISPLLIQPVNPELWYKGYKKYCDLYWTEYENGLLTRQEYQTKRLFSSLILMKIQSFDNVLVSNYQKQCEEKIPSFVKPFPWIKGIVESLYKNGHDVGIISNGGSTLQRKKLKMLGIPFPHERIYISSEISLAKPNTDIFKYVQRRCSSSAFYYIGDSLSFDIKPAVMAGWTGIWWNPTKHMPPSIGGNIYSCSSSEELRNVLMKCIE
ncbi:HAD family hydrolase [Fictibacillus nanhaiensis]|uniref:HAD family hydrolase n=1 Tax=Fictibacillus nanhaiensis TaxID=742169 RepID=UPI00204259D6|nr:HAD family hydrolase [Fictibacillus nanhaiensis]MCM3730688.1 HAD family hydrolase [Fictibacillus nanhaiensis]